MQSMCEVAIPQFHILITLFNTVFFVLQIENYSNQRLLLAFAILQLLASFIILGLGFLRPKYQIKKTIIICLVCLYFGTSFYLIIEDFKKDCLVLFIIQFLSVAMIFSLVVLPNKHIGFVIQIQIFIVAVGLDLMSFYLYYVKGIFNFNRAISVMGSGGMEIITLIMCIICQINPQKRLADEIHLIVGFFIFCELFVSCTFVAECANQKVNIYLIGLTILKISNIFLDMILYSFVKLNYPENQKNTSRIDIEQPPQKIELRSIATRETISDYQNVAQKIDSEPIRIVRKPCPSIQWIQNLLKIH